MKVSQIIVWCAPLDFSSLVFLLKIPTKFLWNSFTPNRHQSHDLNNGVEFIIDDKKLSLVAYWAMFLASWFYFAVLSWFSLNIYYFAFLLFKCSKHLNLETIFSILPFGMLKVSQIIVWYAPPDFSSLVFLLKIPVKFLHLKQAPITWFEEWSWNFIIDVKNWVC